MINKENLKLALFVALVVVLVQVGIAHLPKKTQVVLGISSMLAEDYMPYLRTNGGYYSALPIQTTSTFTTVGITNTGTLTQSGASTFSSTVAFTGAVTASSTTVVSTFTQGGGVRATSTSNTAETLLASDFDTENVIDYTFNGAVSGGTVALPASTTLPLSTNVGAMRTIWIRNATTTANTNIQILGNTGVLFKVASSTNQIGGGGGAGAQQIYGDTDANNMARIDLVRKANSDIIANFIPFRDN